MPSTEKTLRVLIVDDNRDGADALGLLVEALGRQVHVTGLKDEGHKTLALKSGFDAFLVKPVTLAEIKAVLGKIVPRLNRRDGPPNRRERESVSEQNSVYRWRKLDASAANVPPKL